MRAKAWTSLYHEISGLNKLFTPNGYVSSFLTKQDPKLETKSFDKGVLTKISTHNILNLHVSYNTHMLYARLQLSH